MNSLPPVANLIPFPVPATSFRPVAGEFTSTRAKILLKTRPGHPVTDAYGIELIDAARLTALHPEIAFSVELRRDHLRQSLLCGLLTSSYTAGVAVAIDPVTGCVMDLIHEAGVIGYMNRSCLGFEEPFRVEIRMQRFGRNLIATVAVDDECFLYPACLTGPEDIYQAMVGSDVDSGSSVSYRHAFLHAKTFAKVA